MSTSHKPQVVVAVDGGGSKTRALVALAISGESLLKEPSVTSLGKPSAGQASVIGASVSGPGNPRAVGFESAQRHIAEAIRGAIRQAQEHPLATELSLSLLNVDSYPIDTLMLSLAGVGRTGDRNTMLAWAEGARLARSIKVTTDADPLLAFLAISRAEIGSATSAIERIDQRIEYSLDSYRDAIAVISGTGSFCFGTTASGERRSCGGWGGILGDEGGGYWFAIEALKAVTRQSDGRGAETLLTGEVMRYFGLKDPTELIGVVYNAEMTRDQLAKLSGVVFEVARYDVIAGDIVERGAVALAELIATVAKKLGFTQSSRPILGLAGGNFCNQPLLAQATISILEKENWRFADVVSIQEPALGGIVLAGQVEA